MGMGFAPTWLRQVSPPPLLHMTTLTTAQAIWGRLCVCDYRKYSLIFISSILVEYITSLVVSYLMRWLEWMRKSARDQRTLALLRPRPAVTATSFGHVTFSAAPTTEITHVSVRFVKIFTTIGQLTARRRRCVAYWLSSITACTVSIFWGSLSAPPLVDDISQLYQMQQRRQRETCFGFSCGWDLLGLTLGLLSTPRPLPAVVHLLFSFSFRVFHVLLFLSLHFNDHFTDHGSGLTGTRTSPFCILLEN